MKTKREMTLAQALEEIDSATQEIKSRGAAVVDGREYNLDEPVTLEIESEAKKKKAELEFEIKFKPGAMPEAKEAEPSRRRGRMGLLLGAASAAAIATALIVSRRRRRSEDGEDEFGG
jgi:hypothetical protein